MLTIVGLGPGGAEQMTVAARDALRAATTLILRTARHPAADDLRGQGLTFASCDDLYESGSTFSVVYDSIVERVLSAARQGDLVYGVPGHPMVAEETVRRLLPMARAAGIEYRIVDSPSFIEPVLSAAGASLGDRLAITDALSIEEARLDANSALIVFQVYDRDAAARVKLALMRRWSDDAEVAVVCGAGPSGGPQVTWTALHRLDRVPVDHLSSVYVPPMPRANVRPQFEDLLDVMARLRAEDGCPWDREQDHLTLRRYLIEECFEAIEAIEADDIDGLCDELGDILLQVVFHAQIEAEAGVFDAEDVVAGLVAKLVRRHPHVFGDASVVDSAGVVANWDAIKRTEKPAGWRESVLDGVPAGLPALMRADALSRRAAKVGFEWERLDDVFAKVHEEVDEIRAACAADDGDAVSREIGDLLFAVVNLARWRKVDPEASLREMLARFAARFRRIEQAAHDRRVDLSDLTLAEMDAVWEQAKRDGL